MWHHRRMLRVRLLRAGSLFIRDWKRNRSRWKWTGKTVSRKRYRRKNQKWSCRLEPTLHDSSVAVEKAAQHYQFKGKYILTSVKSGLMIIDQQRAHVRILYDQYMEQIAARKAASQGMLFPDMVPFLGLGIACAGEYHGRPLCLGI